MNFKKAIRNIKPLITTIRTLRRIIQYPSALIKYGTLPNFIYSLPGHYDSPIPDLKYIKSKASDIFNRTNKACKGIDLQSMEQLHLLEQFSIYYKDLPFTELPSNSYRYYYNNFFFTYGDGIFLYCFLRHFSPKQIVEVGSGFSSALMLDVNEHYKNHSINFTFIEPFPKRLNNILKDKDKNCIEIIEKKVQEVPEEIFQKLDSGDILFIDSSHISKIGSDVNYLFFHILPILKHGVIIHIHDLYWPFEYLEEMVFEGRAWNEAYLLRAFLQFNNSFQIIFFNDFLAKCYSEKIQEKMPLVLKNTTNGNSSIWLQKIK